MAQIAPPFMRNQGGSLPSSSDIDRVIQRKVGLFGRTCPCQQIVQNMETPLAGGHSCDAASLQTMIEDFAPNQSGVNGRRAVVLQFEKQSGFGGSRRSNRLGSRQGIKNKGSE